VPCLYCLHVVYQVVQYDPPRRTVGDRSGSAVSRRCPLSYREPNLNKRLFHLLHVVLANWSFQAATVTKVGIQMSSFPSDGGAATKQDHTAAKLCKDTFCKLPTGSSERNPSL
jgi:hypothetical protein